MPARSVEDQDDLLGGSGSCLVRKGGEVGLEERDAHTAGQMEERAPQGPMDEAHQLAPGIAVLDGGNRSLANRRPDVPQERLEANPMLIRCHSSALSYGKAVATSLRSGRSFFELLR